MNQDWQLYALLSLPMLYFLIFKYIPMYGVTIAFKDFNMFQGIWKSPWVGLDAFREIFLMKDFYKVLRNTMLLNLLDLVVSFPAPIVLAVLLNEIRIKWFKKGAQTVLYLPHFISWVIIGGMVYQLLSTNTGLVNILLKSSGMKAIPFLTEPIYWVITYVGSGVWQNAGWGTIIYLAALAGINKELYEAAEVDGAGRLRKIWNITLPGIKPTIMILLIINIGNMASIGFERPFVLANPLVTDVSDVISTFVYKVGVQSARFTIATAIGLFQAVVGLIFLLSSNYISKSDRPRHLVRGRLMKVRASDKIIDSFIILLVTVASFICLVPILHLVAVSLSSNAAILSNKVTVFPVEWSTVAYESVFKDAKMVSSLFFTILLVSVFTVVCMIMTICAAYPLTKKRLKGRDFF